MNIPRIALRHWKPVWPTKFRYSYRPWILIGVYIGRLDDFDSLPPTCLTFRLRLFLIQSFLLQIRLPDWVDRRRYARWDQEHRR